MNRMTWLAPVLALTWLGVTSTLLAQETGGGDQGALAKAVMNARVSLERGLAVGASQGRPLSAKFELEGGHLHLSVYTAKGGKFFEVIVDDSTGKVQQVEAITEGEDLSAATAQNAAMATVKMSLRAAVEQALRGNAGFHAVSVTPLLKDRRPVADVGLAKGDERRTVSVPLQ